MNKYNDQIKHATGNSVKPQRQNNIQSSTNSNNNPVANNSNNPVTNNITNNIHIHIPDTDKHDNTTIMSRISSIQEVDIGAFRSSNQVSSVV